MAEEKNEQVEEEQASSEIEERILVGRVTRGEEGLGIGKA